MSPATAEPLSPQVLIPDLLRATPRPGRCWTATASAGCGGPLGPHESLAFFARAHDVPLDRLLAELRAARRRPGRSPTGAPAAVVGRRHLPPVLPGRHRRRPDPRGGLGGLPARSASPSAGTVHGRRAARGQRPRPRPDLRLGRPVRHGVRLPGVPAVQAHGRSRTPGLAYLSFGLMLGGLVGPGRRCEPLAAGSPPLARARRGRGRPSRSSPSGSSLCVIAATWRRSGKRLAFYDWYVLCALVWFVVQAVYEAVYLAATFARRAGRTWCRWSPPGRGRCATCRSTASPCS